LFRYDVAQTHEIKPHRRTIPLESVRHGSYQLRLTLIVSPAGDVIDANPSGDPNELKFWPQIKGEVHGWKFIPFIEHGKSVSALVEEYVDLVPQERLPKVHVPAPVLRSDSKVIITLKRGVCYGTCPSYSVTVSTDGIIFEGGDFVAASGKHTDTVDADEVRKLARKFVAADFYSMDAEYADRVTDNPTYVLAISIDGHEKEVMDYVGRWEGMPTVITELENEVDAFARTQRWIKGGQRPNH
jgi:hypothetical protein